MIGILTIALAILLLSTDVNAAEMSAAQAYQLLKETGSLSSDWDNQIVITDSFKLARLNSSNDPIEFYNVRFEGGIDARTYRSTRPLMFRNSFIRTFDATEANWSNDLIFWRTEIGSVLFKNNVFRGKYELINSTINRLLDFSGAIFHKPVQILGGFARKARFSGTQFMQHVAFDSLKFGERASFVSTLFEAGASFVETKSGGPVIFNRVTFVADAEFRKCQFHYLEFGGFDRVVFKRLADFRGCTISTFIVTQTDFYGDVNFLGTKFGPGGARFDRVFMGGKNTYFEGVMLEGPIVFEASYMPNFRFHWSEISKALLRSNPDTTTLKELQARSSALGRLDDALSLEFYAATKKTQKKLTSHESSFSERAQAAVEYALWGLPTGYGTKLDKILLIAISLWLLGTVPLLLTEDKLYRLPTSLRNSTSELKEFRFRPKTPDALPSNARQSQSLVERILVTLGFSFATIFKVPVNVRYVESEVKPIGTYPVEKYLIMLWGLGAFLLILIGLTLSKTSPIISKIVGELF